MNSTKVYSSIASSSMKTALALSACASALFLSSAHFIDAELMPKWVGMIACVLPVAGYTVLRFLLHPERSKAKKQKRKDLILSIILLTTFAQAVYGLLQYAGICSSGSLFQVTGSFDNPAGFTASLCAAFPFYLFAFSNSKSTLKWSICLMAVLLAAAVVVSESRAGMLSLTAVLSVRAMFYIRSSHKQKWILALLLLSGTTAGLYFIKKDSADGRLFIWERSLSMMKDNWLTGYGTGGFEAHYMDCQADFFKANPESPYIRLADNVQYPFSEYIRVMVDYGIIGLLILLCWVLYLLSCCFRHPSEQNRTALLCWLSVGVFAAFSYPLMFPFVWLMLAYSCYLLIQKDVWRLTHRVPMIIQRSVALTIICLLAYSGLSAYSRTQAELEWKRVSNLSLCGKSKEAFSAYAKLYPSLKTDRYFLYNYSAELYQAEEYRKSLAVALQCRARWADYDVEMLLGQLYEQLEQPQEAERHYWKASYMCPSKFMPLYQLALLLQKEKRHDESRKMAAEIINKEEKVPSVLVAQIKNEMQQYIEHHVRETPHIE